MWRSSLIEDAEKFYQPDKTLPLLPEFYRGKTILVTGGLGFLGQNLIEKLLWACPQVGCVYLLIRDKKNKTAQQRLDHLLQQDTFTRLRNRDDSYKEKIRAIRGDLFEPDLGLSPQDRDKVVSEVDIVVHSAASVLFDEPLTQAIKSNIKATQYLIQLALQIHHLCVFTYVSTAYTNCHLSSVDERLYEPLADWRQTIHLSNKVDPRIFNTLAPKYNSRMPNTYVFSKHLAEHMIYEYGDQFPLVIVRPAIVCQSYLQPEPGWCCNTMGPPGLTIGIMTGVIRNVLGPKKRLQTDFIPCDVVSDITLFTTYLRPFQKKNLKPIYNISSNEHDQDMENFANHVLRVIRTYPAKISLWKPNLILYTSIPLFYINFILFQLLPALLVDLLLKLFGRKPMLLAAQKTFYKQTLATAYFSLRTFGIANRSWKLIDKYMHEEDRKLIKFVYNPEEVERIVNRGEAMLGCPQFTRKKYLMHKTSRDHDIALRVQRVQDVLDALVKYGFYSAVAWYIYSNSILQHIVNNSIQFLFNF